MKLCKYNNCERPFSGRTNQNFCCIKCKRCHNKQVQRETNRLKGESKHIKDLIKQYEETKIDDKLIELYKNIYR